MADDRKIIHGVRVGKETITDVDELDKAAAKDSTIDMQRLFDTGAITGNWKGVKAAAEKTAKKEK